jgi:NAD(P)-dependent dehydrogenase (short-subunit alcohol dehydrogenase family)
MATNPNNKVALVIGAGDATGGTIAKRFAAGGYTAFATPAGKRTVSGRTHARKKK